MATKRDPSPLRREAEAVARRHRITIDSGYRRIRLGTPADRGMGPIRLELQDDLGVVVKDFISRRIEKEAAAERLGVGVRTFYRRMAEHLALEDAASPGGDEGIEVDTPCHDGAK
jgi:hypothetical protein